MCCAEIPPIFAICPTITPPLSSLVGAMLSNLEAAVSEVPVAGRSACASQASATPKANPHVSRPSRATPPAFTVERPFTDRLVGVGNSLSTDAEDKS
jgi:hypothetical protein